YLGGEWLDGKLGTEPWLKWIGLGFGLAAGARSLYRVVRRAQRIMEEEDESP
ncbi:MAG: AtpZ/AtpI family protein, partial [Deltaproteobacteria bacterium]|nr:AtpZ/AtpI family protein [Deltaproteobacteria bacterium]